MTYRITCEVGSLAVDGWAVAFGTARRGLGGAAARPGSSSLYRFYPGLPVRGRGVSKNQRVTHRYTRDSLTHSLTHLLT